MDPKKLVHRAFYTGSGQWAPGLLSLDRGAVANVDSSLNPGHFRKDGHDCRHDPVVMICYAAIGAASHCLTIAASGSPMS